MMIQHYYTCSDCTLRKLENVLKTHTKQTNKKKAAKWYKSVDSYVVVESKNIDGWHFCTTEIYVPPSSADVLLWS